MNNTSVNEKIEQAKQSNAIKLDLSECGLLEFPREILELESLEVLDLSGWPLDNYANINEYFELYIGDIRGVQGQGLYMEVMEGKIHGHPIGANYIKSIPTEIEKLKNLKHLNLKGNHEVSLPSNIASLANLEILNLSDTKLREVPEEVGKIESLKTLDLSYNTISELPESLAGLSNLVDLFLNFNDFSHFPEIINQLVTISCLDLGDNFLSAIPTSIANLTNLERLTLSNKVGYSPSGENKIQSLPKEIASLEKLRVLDLKENPIQSPPVEIVNRGVDAVRSYLRSLYGEQRAINELKVIFVGDGGVGKTSLIKQINNENFNKNEPQTHGVNIKDFWLDDGQSKTKLNLWDFGGQAIMHATHQFFLSKRSLYVLVLDARKEQNVEYWLRHIISFGGDSPIIVVINKIDENENYDLNRNFLKQKYPNIVNFCRTSCATKEGVDTFVNSLKASSFMIDHIHTLWSQNWFRVKEQIESLNQSFIDYDYFENLCIENQIVNEVDQETLIHYFHDLGTALYFQELHLLNTYVLDPEWVTTAVYKIINSPDLARSNGLLLLSSLSNILKSIEERPYPIDKHGFIVELMRKFEICFQTNSNQLLFPASLPINEPNFEFDYSSSIHFEIVFDFMPQTIMSRFMVNLYQDIKENLRWRTGVVLRSDDFGCEAVVKSDEEAKRISIYVNGELKRDYFTVILYFLREISEDFKVLNRKELVPLPDNPNISISHQHLLRLATKGEAYYFPDGADREYNVLELLGLIHAEQRSQQEILRILRKLEKQHDNEESMIEKANKVIDLKPNIAGLGININALIDIIMQERHK